jgi:hypothetical protein
MSLSARRLREQRKHRIAARKKKKARVRAQGEEGAPDVGDEDEEDVPDWLEEKIDEDGDGEEFEEGTAQGDDMPPADLPEEEEGMPADLPEDEEGLEEEEEEMPPMEEEEPMASIQAAFNYNPLYQKPTKLGSQGPSGGYHYYGPAPDAGTSYGYFVDAGSKVKIISPLPAKGKKVFSPVSGKPMKCVGKVGVDGVATILAFAESMKKLAIAEGEERFTSVPIDKVTEPQMFDALTGEDISESIAQEPEEEMMPPMEEEEMPPEEMPPMEGQEEELEEEGVEEELEEEAEGVEYEALQSLDEMGDEPVAEPDVHMTLFDEGTAEAPGENPYWNIDVGGTPIARVYLKDQPKPAEIRKVFCSADYYRGVSGAIAKVGLKPVLKQIKAKLWANEVRKTKLAKNIQAEVDAASQKRVQATTKNLAKDLLRRVAIVCAGMDKNFYKDLGNPLKEALWAELHKHGKANPSPLIEAAFRQGSTAYFEAVLTKAMEYMDTDPKALEEIQNAIGDMDVMPPGDDTVGDEIPEVALDGDGIPSPDDAATLSERLAASSVAVAGMSALAGNPIGEHKETLKSELKLGGAGPRLR